MRNKLAKCISVTAAAVLLLTGCGNAPDASEEAASSAADSPYDYDLTGMEANMLYAQIYNMTFYSDDYKGKTFKISGTFNYYRNSETDERFLVYVADAAACCGEGVEFVLDSSYTYPDDYPAIGDPITVAGTFEPFKEYGMPYCRLVDAEMFREEDEK